MVVKIASKGAHGFAMILRYLLFNILPTMVEVILVLIVIGVKYDAKYALISTGSFIVYLILTFFMTEWRAKHFKEQSFKEAIYIQIATDSLLNFETVKYSQGSLTLRHCLIGGAPESVWGSASKMGVQRTAGTWNKIFEYFGLT